MGKRSRGRSAEPRPTDVPDFVTAPPRDAVSLDRFGARTVDYNGNGGSDDEETSAYSLTSRSSARKKLKKMFKKKKKKKKNRYSDQTSVSSASFSRGKSMVSPFKSNRVSGSQEFFSRTNPSFNEVELLAQKKKMTKNDRFKVFPDAAYPNTYLNRDELREEMNQKSGYYHDLRVPYKKGKEIGQLRLEILQCFGLPSASVIRDVSAYAIAVCGSHAFKTDVMPAVPNPMWLSQMRRACMFPIFHAYDRVFIGVFDHGQGEGSSNSDFIGRVVIDIARLRAGCMYDITLPLRQSSHVFSRTQQGAIRVRFHLIWVSERSAVMSYLPKSKPKFHPDEHNKINCLDERSFRNVAHLVHGQHMPGKFSMTLLKATIREMNFNRIHIFRYVRRREIYNLRYWVYPFISGFVFCAWMHSVIANTTRFIPGHILTFFLMRLYLNYAYYAMDSPLQNGFTAPSMEELFDALLYGTKGKRKKYIKALNMQTDDTNVINPEKHMEAEAGYEDSNGGEVQLSDIAEAMRKSVRTQRHKYRLRTYNNCFLGTEAVDFLTNFGYAYTRSEAVVLGRRLAHELKVFEHVARKKDFEDDKYYYHFLNYDSKKYVITGHSPRFKRVFQTIGFVNRDLDPNIDHVEFPFAQGTDHPRFTVKEALVLRSAEAKKIMKEKEEAREIVDCAEFGVAPALIAEEEIAQSMNPGELMRTGIRRGSTVASATLNAAVNLPQNIMNLPSLGQNLTMRRRTMEFGDPEELYGRLKERQNPTLNELLESRKFTISNFDPYADDSDDDVENISKKRRKGTIIEEKILSKPPNQDFSKRSGGGDKPFSKSMSEIRHKVHGVFFHLFNDRVYKVDQTLFPAKHPEENAADAKAVTTKRGLFGRRKLSNETDKDKEKGGKKKKELRTPYDERVEEYDRILQINKYSHPNPWINRVAVIVQPMVEIVQVPLFFSRAVFNLMTWQDVILSFWVAIIGPGLVLVLHFMPYRILFGIAGVYLFGPQNWLYRLFQQTKPGYEPPTFDRIIKRKKAQKQEPYSEIQLFSSMAPGNQHIKFKNVDPQQVKQVIVPSSVLKYNRFYDWPPEPEYARVYQAPPPKNINLKKAAVKELNADPSAAELVSVESGSDGENEEGYESSDSYWYDATLARTKKKKKKKGLKKVGHQIKKGTGVVVGTSVEAGGALTGAVLGVTGAVVGTTVGATIGIAKVTGKVTKKAVKGTANFTAGAMEGAGNAASYMGEGIRRRRSKPNIDFDKEDFSQFDDDGYNDYYDD
eukprot:scaffold1334_cov123-Cylindrotheca_fusiformis.AAC.4